MKIEFMIFLMEVYSEMRPGTVPMVWNNRGARKESPWQINPGTRYESLLEDTDLNEDKSYSLDIGPLNITISWKIGFTHAGRSLRCHYLHQ